MVAVMVTMFTDWPYPDGDDGSNRATRPTAAVTTRCHHRQPEDHGHESLRLRLKLPGHVLPCSAWWRKPTPRPR